MSANFDLTVKPRIVKRMADIDALSPDIRGLVHEFGWTVVSSFLDAGVTKAARIMHLIKVVHQGSTEGHARPLVFLDDAPHALARRGLSVVPTVPSRLMLEASMAEVSNFNVVVNREEKHRRRLVAAIAAGAKEGLRNDRRSE